MFTQSSLTDRSPLAPTKLSAKAYVFGSCFLVVIFTKRKNLIRVISARDMNKRERKFYNEKG